MKWVLAIAFLNGCTLGAPREVASESPTIIFSTPKACPSPKPPPSAPPKLTEKKQLLEDLSHEIEELQQRVRSLKEVLGQ